MDKDYNSEMKQRSDLYLHLFHEEENEKEKKELEQQQFEETQARFEKFMGSNQEMFDFLA